MGAFRSATGALFCPLKNARGGPLHLLWLNWKCMCLYGVHAACLLYPCILLYLLGEPSSPRIGDTRVTFFRCGTVYAISVLCFQFPDLVKDRIYIYNWLPGTHSPSFIYTYIFSFLSPFLISSFLFRSFKVSAMATAH